MVQFFVLCFLLFCQGSIGFVKVNVTSKQFVDVLGRSRLFHGVNVVYKHSPYYPPNGSFDPQYSFNDDDIKFLVDNGFSMVRLYVAWPGVERTRGNYNTTYLDVLESIVNRLAKYEIHTLLDCHQDLFSPKFCGEGAPDFAALYKNASHKPLDFPVPVTLTPYQVDPKTGYPLPGECQKHSFFTYYFSDACGQSWESFYQNEQGVQDAFLKFWEVVADRFKSNPYVLGYELINEPWAGNVYRHPELLEPKKSDITNLAPLYQKLHKAIRTVDNDHIIFFEPTVIISQLPFSSTGLTEGPGGPAYNDRQVYSFHVYCILQGKPLDSRLCDDYEVENYNVCMEDLKKLGTAGFMTEWGAYSEMLPNSKEYFDAINILDEAESHLMSWSYWQYKGFGDFTTQSGDSEGLYYKNGSVQIVKLRVLSRTYAQAVAGRIVKESFDTQTGNFTLQFHANTTITAATIIYLNEKLYYITGYAISVIPSDVVKVTKTTNIVKLTYTNKAVTGQTITVDIKKI